MFILSRGLRSVGRFIFCIALLTAAGCSKQALVDPGTTNTPLPPPGSFPPLYIPVNNWSALSLPDNTHSFARPFVVDNKVYVGSQGALYRYNEANGTWSKIDSNMDFHYDDYLFSNQSKAYFLKHGKYLHAYDVNTHTWTNKATYPGAYRYQGTHEATATKGYIMGGQSDIINQFTILHTENWEYNFANDTWTKKANTPGPPRYRACSFAVGDKIYFGAGATMIIKIEVNPVKTYQEQVYLKDWWEYNTLTNTWTQKADFGGGIREFASGFVLNGKIYAGAGDKGNNDDELSDLWRYDPGSNTWLSRQACPIGGVYWNDVMYVGTNSLGYGVNKEFDQFWQYKP